MRKLLQKVRHIGQNFRDRRGSVLTLVAAGIVIFLAMAMFTVDVAYMQLTRTELRVASDAAAKAGCAELVKTQNGNSAIQAAIASAALNSVGGKTLVLRTQDVTLGASAPDNSGAWIFTPNAQPYNAVRVNLALTPNTPNGEVKLFFAPIFSAGTYQPSRVSTASAFQQEICLVIDRSHSMCFNLTGIDWAYPPGVPGLNNSLKFPPKPGSRWASLQNAMTSYINIVQNTNPSPRVALVTWASAIGTNTTEFAVTGVTSPAVTNEVGLTKTYSLINTAIAARTANVMVGGTDMSGGIDAGVSVLTASGTLKYARKTMVLMTDGQWNRGRNPTLAAQDAAAAGITIHCVGFLPAGMSADLQQVAAITGGRYYTASNEAQLIAAFQELARMLPVVLTD